MATLDDILTTQKNGVIAINNINQTLSSIASGINAYTDSVYYLAGKITSSLITTNTVLLVGSGRIVNFSITAAGTGAGTIHNASTVISAVASNSMVATPTTAGVYQIGLQFTDGLVVRPGTGQSLVVTYSTD